MSTHRSRSPVTAVAAAQVIFGRNRDFFGDQFDLDLLQVVAA